jgi:peptide deformylase
MILLDEHLSREPAQLATIDEAIEIIKQLEYELKHSSIKGVGLAAPQIGIQKAVAIIRVNDGGGNVNLINPKLIDGHDLIEYNEGCLSFPGQSVKTIRYNEIVVETLSDYEHYSEGINSARYRRDVNNVPIISNSSKIYFGIDEDDISQFKQIDQLISVCIQHEMAHLIGLDFMDFQPIEVGRNDRCPCGSDKKAKKCGCAIPYYNNNLKKLFNPNYRSIQ